MHPVVGNNIGLLNIVGAKEIVKFASYNGNKIGFIGDFFKPTSLQEISTKLEKQISTKCTVIDVLKDSIKRVAIVSGACDRNTIYEAKELGADLLITGEQSEYYHDAHDYGISIIFAGHHASETVGVSLLMDQLSEKFSKLNTIFVDNKTGL